MGTDLPAGWQQVALADLVDQRGITYGVVQPGKAVDNGTPILRVNNLIGGSLRLDNVLRIDPEIAERYRRSKLVGGEVLISLVGSVGHVAIAPPSTEGWNVARAVGVIPVREAQTANWVATCLRSPHHLARLSSRFNTTVQITLNLKDLASHVIPLPPVPEQRAIVSVLGALDDKIESNRRRSDSTWAVVSERFRHCCPLVGGTGATLGDYTAVVMGQAPPGSSYADQEAGGGLPMLQGNAGFGLRFAEPGVWTVAPTRVVEAGTPLMTVRAPVGAVNLASSRLCLGRGVAGFVSDRPVFIECLLREIRRVGGWVAHESGTIYPSVNRAQIAGLSVGRLDLAVADDFDRWAAPLAASVRTLHRESHTLAAIRDGLVPKLVAGQIRVPLSDDPGEQVRAVREAVGA